MSTTQKTVHAATEADLVYLLTQHGFLAAGQPIAGVTGWAYLGPWSLAGTPMPDVAAHVWWINEPADVVEADARQETLAALRALGALHEGTDVACSLLGTVGQPQRPSDHAMIGVLRDLHRKACGVQAAGKWWHSDDQSRDLYAQAAALIACDRSMKRFQRSSFTTSGTWFAMALESASATFSYLKQPTRSS